MNDHRAPLKPYTRLHLRIFISSPGDVQEERTLARKLISEKLSSEPGFRDVFMDAVAWDNPAEVIPMLANEATQGVNPLSAIVIN